MKKVLLLNPPGTRPYLRDYYCSKVSKAGYLYHPVDLTFQSALLTDRHSIQLMDSIAEKRGVADTIDRISRYAPDAVLCLVAAVSWDEDLEFLRILRRSYSGRIVLTGDVFLEDPETILEQIPEADAALLDFTSPGFGAYVDRPDDTAADMVVRCDGSFTAGFRSPRSGEFSIGIPRYDLFPNEKYRYPFVRRKPFATVLTDYGCPFPCTFCIMNTIGYRIRPTDEVMEELFRLKRSGFRELYINDQTFGASKPRTFELLERMATADLGFGWVCFTRTDIFDEEMAFAMKAAGCHTVMFGVESADRGILDAYHKNTGPENARRTVELCRRMRMRTVATFLIGLPEDTDETVEATIRFAIDLDPDYASFNFAVPRRGTDLRRKAVNLGLADPDIVSMDQAGETIAMPTKGLSKNSLRQWRGKALRRFFLRPGYIARRSLVLRSFYEIETSVIAAKNVLLGALGKG